MNTKNEYYFCISFNGQEKYVRTNSDDSEIIISNDGVWKSSTYPKPYPIMDEGESVIISRERYQEIKETCIN